MIGRSPWFREGKKKEGERGREGRSAVFSFFGKMKEYLFGAFTGVAILSIGYLIYFDHKRKDPKFRRRVKRERKEAQEIYNAKVAYHLLTFQSSERAAKMAELTASSAAAAAASTGGMQFTESFLKELEAEPEPKTLPEKEAYFIKHLDIGEKLLAKGMSTLCSLTCCRSRFL